jgi:hypothetical protein
MTNTNYHCINTPYLYQYRISISIPHIYINTPYLYLYQYPISISIPHIYIYINTPYLYSLICYRPRSVYTLIYFPVTYHPLLSQALLIIEVSRTHSDTHTHTHTLSGTSMDERSNRRRHLYLRNTKCSQETDIHAPGGIRTRNPTKQVAADPLHRPHGHWDRRVNTDSVNKLIRKQQ